MASYQDHLDNMQAEEIASANKALDYLDDIQVSWLEEYMNREKGGIKHWMERGFAPITSKVVADIINRTATRYNESPLREVVGQDGTVNEEASEIYRNILSEGDFDGMMDEADSVCRLLKNVIILAQAVEVVGSDEKVMLSILHRGNCDVDYDFKNGVIRSLMYRSLGSSVNGNALYHYWDAQQVKDIEIDDNGQRILATDNHGYGMIPAVVLWDTFKPRAGFWYKPVWEALVNLNEQFNLFLTEVRFASKYQTTPIIVTNMRLPDGLISGPDTVLELEPQPGEQVYFEFKNATNVQGTLKAFREFFDDLIIQTGAQWGANIKAVGAGTASSGFQLVVEEFPTLELRKKRIKAALTFEAAMYKVIKAISDARGYGLPDNSKVSVEFPEPALPVNAKEEWEITKEKIGIKYLLMEDAWRIDDPEITPEEILERKTALGIGVAVPSFGAIVEEGN